MNERVAALDASFFTLDSDTTQQVIASYSPLDRIPDLERARQSVLRQIEAFPKMRKRIVEHGGLRWSEDTSFDIKRHVRFECVPLARTERDLMRRAEQIFSSHLDLEHPPWEYVVLSSREQPEPDALVGLLFRIHHGLADGLGALEFFHRACDLHPSGAELEAVSARSHRHAGQTGAGPKAGKWRLRQSIAKLLTEARERVVKNPLNGENSAERRFAHIEFPLHDLKSLRRKYRTSLNDLLLALVTGAVRRYQLSVSFSPINVKALVPFNLRPKTNLTTLGNQLTGVGVPLPAAIADPVERLKTIQTCFNRIKSDGSFGAYRIVGILNSYLPRRLQRRLSEAAARRSNFICTNMPGPDKPLYFGGAKLLGQYGFAALMHEQGIAFAFMTYAGKACVSVVSDPAVVPDPWQIVSYVKEAFEELACTDAGTPLPRAAGSA
ncbi:MAG: WS/DGAT domain-containing protein [Bdellovibrionota bacterium]